MFCGGDFLVRRQNQSTCNQAKSLPNLDGKSEFRERNEFAQGECTFLRVVPTILLVSNDNFRVMVRAYLEHAGFAVVSGTDMRRAPEIASGTPDVSLLLLDLRSSGTEGLQIAVEMEEMRTEIPTVIMSGDVHTEQEAGIVDSHAWKLVRQPLRLPELLAAIRLLFDCNERQRHGWRNLRSATNMMPFCACDARRPALSLSALPAGTMASNWRKARGR